MFWNNCCTAFQKFTNKTKHKSKHTHSKLKLLSIYNCCWQYQKVLFFKIVIKCFSVRRASVLHIHKTKTSRNASIYHTDPAVNSYCYILCYIFLYGELHFHCKTLFSHLDRIFKFTKQKPVHIFTMPTSTFKAYFHN